MFNYCTIHPFLIDTLLVFYGVRNKGYNPLVRASHGAVRAASPLRHRFLRIKLILISKVGGAMLPRYAIWLLPVNINRYY